MIYLKLTDTLLSISFHQSCINNARYKISMPRVRNIVLFSTVYIRSWMEAFKWLLFNLSRKQFKYSSGNNTPRAPINSIQLLMYHIVGKFGRKCLANLLFSSVWWKKVWQMNRSAKGLSMITINLDDFSLANRRRFAKFAKVSPCQTFPLYGMFLAHGVAC